MVLRKFFLGFEVGVGNSSGVVDLFGFMLFTVLILVFVLYEFGLEIGLHLQNDLSTIGGPSHTLGNPKISSCAQRCIFGCIQKHIKMHFSEIHSSFFKNMVQRCFSIYYLGVSDMYLRNTPWTHLYGFVIHATEVNNKSMLMIESTLV